MSRISFENYAARSRCDVTLTEMAGRHAFQQQEETNIPGDVARKLDLQPEDDLLEIGCGTGNVLIPLSAMVRTATGIDHADPLAVFRGRLAPSDHIPLLEGNFLDLELSGSYSKVLVYSVLHYLSDNDEVMSFIQRAAALLAPGGALLLGDIPNDDKRKRFLATRRGAEFQQQWESMVKAEGPQPGFSALPPDTQVARFDDETIARILLWARQQGFESYLLPQPENLPMCFSREDILIRRLVS